MDNTRILKGKEGIRQAYELALTSKKVNSVCLSLKYEVVVGDIFNEYDKKRTSLGIPLRDIICDVDENRGMISNDNLEVKYLKLDKYPETDLLVSDERVVLISFDKDNPSALVIEDKNTISAFQVYFEKLWDSANK